MKISTLLILSTGVLTGFFVVVASLLLIYNVHVSHMTDQLIEESIPTLQTLEHLRTIVYEENSIVYEYLLLDNFTAAQQMDQKLQIAEDSCKDIIDAADDQMARKELHSQKVTDAYDNAVLIYSSLSSVRRELLNIHKNNIVLGDHTRTKEDPIFERYRTLQRQSIDSFEQSIQSINEQNTGLHKEVLSGRTAYSFAIISFLSLLVLISIISGFLLKNYIAKPLDELIEQSQEFVSGRYDARVKSLAPIRELQELEDRINNVFEFAEGEIKQNPEQGKIFQKQLLPKQYKDILEFIKTKEVEGAAISISDIKKAFNLTHPTVQARLQHLEKTGHIRLEKHGRNKLIYTV